MTDWSFGRTLRFEPTLYGGGSTVPPDWPERATAATYEQYARLPSWHVEEAAALLAGYIPREQHLLNFRPLHDTPKKPAPYESAQTWGQLLAGEIGVVLSLFSRHRRVSDWSLSGENLHVTPSEFLAFCDECGIPVRDELRDAVSGRDSPSQIPAKGAAARRRASQSPEEHYKTHAVRVLQNLKDAGVRVTTSDLQTLVESQFDGDAQKILHRTFQAYLAKWGQSGTNADPLRKLLSDVLWNGSGRPADEYKHDLQQRLPAAYARILWPNWKPQKKLRK